MISEIAMNSVRPLDGILSHLSQKHGGNVHDKGIVTITSSSVISTDPQYSAKNLADVNKGCIFSSKNEVNQWVQLDFHYIRVNPIRYSLQSHNCPSNCFHLKSWVIEGSIDGSGWTKLERRTNNNDLNGPLLISSFSLSRSIDYRLIRLQ
jgi:hypothetical protein